METVTITKEQLEKALADAIIKFASQEKENVRLAVFLAKELGL